MLIHAVTSESLCQWLILTWLALSLIKVKGEFYLRPANGLPKLPPAIASYHRTSQSLSDPIEGGHHSVYADTGFMGDCVRPFSLDIWHEKGLDPEVLYLDPEHAKTIDMLLNNQLDSANDGDHLPDIATIYQQIEFDSGQVERLAQQGNFTQQDLMLAIKVSSMAVAKMAGIVAIRDLALNPAMQDNEHEGRLAGLRLGVIGAELIAYTVKERVKNLDGRMAQEKATTGTTTTTPTTGPKSKDSGGSTTTGQPAKKGSSTATTSSPSTTKKPPKRRKRQIQQSSRQNIGAYLEDVSQDLSPEEMREAYYSLGVGPYPRAPTFEGPLGPSASTYGSSLLDDESLFDLDNDSSSMANLIYNGYSAQEGPQHGRRRRRREASSEETASPDEDSEATTTTTTTSRKPRRKKKKGAAGGSTTLGPDEPEAGSRAGPVGGASTTGKPASGSTTPGPSRKPTTKAPGAEGASAKVTSTTLGPKGPGSGGSSFMNSTELPDLSGEESTLAKAQKVFDISATTGYVEGHKLAMGVLVTARSLKYINKYIAASDLGFKDGIREGWPIGIRKTIDMAGDIWSKLKHAYNKSSIFDEERPDPYDLGARMGFSVGSVVGYNTGRKPDPTLDGPGGTLERALRAGRPKFSPEEVQRLASKRAAYEASSQAAFRAALKIGFMTGAKLGPKAGLFYTQRSGARSGAKLGATLGAEAGLRAGGDTTARVALHEQSQLMSMVSPHVSNLGTNVAMTCGKETGRVVGALVGALAAAEGFRSYIDNSGYIEAVPTEYMRYKLGAEHGYNLGFATGQSVKINRKSPFYVDPLTKINLNSIAITNDLPSMTNDVLRKMKEKNNITMEEKDNEIEGEFTDKKSGQKFKAKLKLRAYAGGKKSDNLIFKIVGSKSPTTDPSAGPHLDHIYGFLAGSLTGEAEGDQSTGNSKLDQEERALQILYDDAQRGIMPSSRENLKINTALGGNSPTVSPSGQTATGNAIPEPFPATNVEPGTHFLGSIFGPNDSGSTTPKPAEVASVTKDPSAATTKKPADKDNKKKDKTTKKP